MRKIRIQIEGAQARLIDAETGEELRGVTGYALTHQAGAPPLATVTLRACVVALDGEVDANVFEVR